MSESTIVEVEHASISLEDDIVEIRIEASQRIAEISGMAKLFALAIGLPLAVFRVA
jgi:hypothetical protein